jgi:biotin transport system substrate-specific component
MFDKDIQFSTKDSADALIKILLGALVISLLSPIKVDLGDDIDLTLQSLVILLVAMSFGWQKGIAALLIYLLVGALGVPVFPGHVGGYERLLGSLGGFYFGFALATLVCGFWASHIQPRQFHWNVLNWMLGHALILFAGFYWFWQFDPPGDNWLNQLAVLVPGMMVKIAFGVLAMHVIERMVIRGKAR